MKKLKTLNWNRTDKMKLLCKLFGHQWYKVYATSTGSIARWNDTCLRCNMFKMMSGKVVEK